MTGNDDSHSFAGSLGAHLRAFTVSGKKFLAVNALGFPATDLRPGRALATAVDVAPTVSRPRVVVDRPWQQPQLGTDVGGVQRQIAGERPSGDGERRPARPEVLAQVVHLDLQGGDHGTAW